MGTPTHAELCQAAYRFWQERGCPDGTPAVDWQRAEEALGYLREPEAADPSPAARPAGALQTSDATSN